jgi:hypothetical protein
VAYWLFIQHESFVWLLPLLLTAALGFGLVTGIIAQAMLEKLTEIEGSGKW